MKKRTLLSFCCALLLPCAMVTAQNTITLETTTGELTLNDGDVLTGTGGANTHVTIADGASVTLSGVTITAISNGEDDKSVVSTTIIFTNDNVLRNVNKSTCEVT